MELEPENDAFYVGRGYTLLEEGRNDEAIADLTRAIKAYPEHAESYYYRGRAYMAKANFEAAIADFTRAIEIDPENRENYRMRTYIYRHLGYNDLAEEEERKLGGKSSTHY
jgi:tetratricopeptide (TPR) repeat protein